MIANSALLKVLIIGDSGVGKTALMKMYCEKRFDKTYQATIGADFLTKEMQVNGKPITMQIWDTAGQERFKSLVCRFYRGADACILVYDITKPQSFERLDFWMREFIEHADIKDPERFPFLIVGNKHDLHDQQKVSESKAKSWCGHKGGLKFIQASAKVNHNVEQAFTQVVELALDIQEDFEDIYNTNPAPILSEKDLPQAPAEGNSGMMSSLSGMFSSSSDAIRPPATGGASAPSATVDLHQTRRRSSTSGDQESKGIIQIGQETADGAFSWLERNDCC